MLGHCLKKRGRGLDRGIVLDPRVDPGNPPHRHEACPAADPARPYPRMVVLAQGPSGQRARCSSQAKIATVRLGPAPRDSGNFGPVVAWGREPLFDSLVIRAFETGWFVADITG